MTLAISAGFGLQTLSTQCPELVNEILVHTSVFTYPNSQDPQYGLPFGVPDDCGHINSQINRTPLVTRDTCNNLLTAPTKTYFIRVAKSEFNPKDLPLAETIRTLMWTGIHEDDMCGAKLLLE